MSKGKELIENNEYIWILGIQNLFIERISNFKENLERIENAEGAKDLDFNAGDPWQGYNSTICSNFMNLEEHVSKKTKGFKEAVELIENYKLMCDHIDELKKEKLEEINLKKTKRKGQKLSLEEILLIYEGSHSEFKEVNSIVVSQNPRAMHIEYTYGLTFKDKEGTNYKVKFECDAAIDDREGQECIYDSLDSEDYEPKFSYRKGEIKIVGI